MNPLRFAPLAALLCLGFAGCTPSPGSAAQTDAPNDAQTEAPGGALTPFGSDAEFASYLRQLTVRDDSIHRARMAAAQAACRSLARLSRGTRAGAAGQPAVITGRALNQEHTPLAGTAIRLEPSGLATDPNAAGEFRMEVPAAQTGTGLSVRATSAGHTSAAAALALSPGDSVHVEFRLCSQSPAAYGLYLGDSEMVGFAEKASMDAAPAAVAAPEPEAGITNNQHAGVDEGGIVKVHGNHLVVLRRGRLFTVATDGGTLRPVDAVNAYGPGIDGAGGWYDEMLVSGDQIVVIGYNYRNGGTELGIFRISADGRLHHRDTYGLRSNDYYSSENYASRLVGDQLIMYAPVPLRYEDSTQKWMPAMRKWHPGAGADDFRPTLAATQIYRSAASLPADGSLMLHTITTCDLGGASVGCRSTAVVGPVGRVFYVSPTAVYVWTGESYGQKASEDAALYRLPLDGSAPRALGVRGSPLDQFSFLEKDGMLNVLVSPEGAGDGMWRSERNAMALSLLRVPISSFGDGRAQVAASQYRRLAPSVGGSELVNRFVGDHLLYGSGTGWGTPDTARTSHVVHVVRIADAQASVLALAHPVDRIEVLGKDAVIAGADARDLHFTGIRFGPAPGIVQRYTRRNAAQGETRSHGFFYRPDDEDSGLLGLPIRGAGEPGYSQLTQGSASILFLRNADQRFSELGELAADGRSAVDDACVASCADWYGNARPIFLRGRIFALMGYEMVEGTLQNGRLREARRVSFAPPPRARPRGM